MPAKKPSIKQLEYFVTIAHSTNFRKAAAKLGVSQPTLTSQVAAMEEILGVQLFERSRAGTLLSPEGRDLLALARDILDQYQHFLDTAQNSSRELGGTFRIGVSSTIGPYFLPEVLPQLHQRYPNLQLHLREGDPRELESGLQKGNFDFIITVLPMHSTENRVRPLFTEPLKIVVPQSHELASQERISGKMLQGQTVLTIDDHFHLHSQIAGLCERYGAQLRRDYEGNSMDTILQMVMMNMGIAILPGLFVQSELGKGAACKVLELDEEAVVRNHVAAWRINSSPRHLFQKLSFDLKAIALEKFAGILTEVLTEENI
ncbi:MAG: LysR substrate-binding domain-containing protein [Gammaproteobacteria bacterium]|nr:LysR substrate-binding domain-containing protein [Gammaproteobacteria bacterium]